jgi:hypothetical protein
MKAFSKHFVLLVLLATAVGTSAYSQNRERWVVKDAVTTFLQIGVADPVETNFAEQRKICLGKYVYRKGSRLFFSKSLKKSEYYEDTIFIGQRKTIKVAKDDDLTMRYPGNELIEASPTCTNCFVGASFMGLLGLNQLSLTYYDVKANSTTFGFLCQIKENKKIGLYLANDFVILILERD